MAKTLIAPIIGLIVILLKYFGIEVPQDLANGLVDWIVTGASLVAVVYGVFKNHGQKTAVTPADGEK